MKPSRTDAPEQPIEFSDLKDARCPVEAYRRLHDSGIAHDPLTGHYVVADFSTIRQVATQPEQFSSRTGLSVERRTPIQAQIDQMYADQAWPVIHTLLTSDPPLHRRFRALVDRVFTAERVTSMHQYIVSLAQEAIDSFIDRGQVEFVSELATTFPVTIALDFLGLPRSDAAQILEWTHAANKIIDPRFDEATEIACHRKIIELLNYIAAAGQKAVETSDGSFLNVLMLAEVDGRRITMQEFVWLVELITVGGHDSIGLALSSGMVRLIEEPSIAEQLRADPELIGNFVEEVLRTDGPIKCLHRRATSDVIVDGVKIPAGSILQLQWAAGARDPKKFADPDRFLVDRKNPNRHLAFGAGIHFCIGNQLARAELQLAFDAILGRMKNFRYAGTGNDVEFRQDYVQQGPVHLHMAFDKV